MPVEGLELIDLAEQAVAVVRATVAVPDLPAFYDRTFHAVLAAVTAQGAEVAGPPFGHFVGPPVDGEVELEVGFPVTEPIAADGDVRPSVLPGGQVVTGTHLGSYDSLVETYGALQAWMADHGLTPGADMWEVYVSDPREVAGPDELRTQVCWTVA